MVEQTEDPLLFDVNGRLECDEAGVVTYLLQEEVLYPGQIGKCLSLFVICNDIFAWGCADAESLKLSDLLPLYLLQKKTPNKWGSTKWVCLRRNEQPQKPIREKMHADGAWDAEMEALPENKYDRWCRDETEKRRQREAAKQEQPS